MPTARWTPVSTAGTLSSNPLPIQSIAVQPDGRILIAGYGLSWRSSCRSGQADTAEPLAPMAADTYLKTLALQSDGKILLGGGYGFALGGVDRGTLVRLNREWQYRHGFPARCARRCRCHCPGQRR